MEMQTSNVSRLQVLRVWAQIGACTKFIQCSHYPAVMFPSVHFFEGDVIVFAPPVTREAVFYIDAFRTLNAEVVACQPEPGHGAPESRSADDLCQGACDCLGGVDIVIFNPAVLKYIDRVTDQNSVTERILDVDGVAFIYAVRFGTVTPQRTTKNTQSYDVVFVQLRQSADIMSHRLAHHIRRIQSDAVIAFGRCDLFLTSTDKWQSFCTFSICVADTLPLWFWTP